MQASVCAGSVRYVPLFEAVCQNTGQSLMCSSFISKNLKIKLYRTIILPVVLYDYETWSLILGEGRRLRVFENRVLRRIFGPHRTFLPHC
jgi:hypothetical protein